MTTLHLTYRELAARTGRTLEGARMLARNHRWHVDRGNDRKARVTVDESELEVVGQPSGRPGGQPSGDQAVEPVVNLLVVELRDERDRARAETDTLRRELREADKRAAGAEGEVRALRDALADLSDRLGRAEAQLAEDRKRSLWKWLFG